MGRCDLGATGWRIRFDPEVATNGREHIDEGWLRLGIPGCLLCWPRIGGHSRGEQDGQAEESEQARRGARDSEWTPVPLRLEAQMGSDFLAGDLRLPPTDIPSTDLGHGGLLVSAEAGKGLPFTRRVPQEHPAPRQRRFPPSRCPSAVPVARSMASRWPAYQPIAVAVQRVWAVSVSRAVSLGCRGPFFGLMPGLPWGCGGIGS